MVYQFVTDGWLRGTVVEGLSLTGELSLSLCGQTVRYRSANQADSASHPFEVDK